MAPPLDYNEMSFSLQSFYMPLLVLKYLYNMKLKTKTINHDYVHEILASTASTGSTVKTLLTSRSLF